MTSACRYVGSSVRRQADKPKKAAGVLLLLQMAWFRLNVTEIPPRQFNPLSVHLHRLTALTRHICNSEKFDFKHFRSNAIHSPSAEGENSCHRGSMAGIGGTYWIASLRHKPKCSEMKTASLHIQIGDSWMEDWSGTQAVWMWQRRPRRMESSRVGMIQWAVSGSYRKRGIA